MLSKVRQQRGVEDRMLIRSRISIRAHQPFFESEMPLGESYQRM
jgi:hypothetical protein